MIPVVPEPLSYHCDVVAYLHAHENALWQWFGTSMTESKHQEGLRISLLKSCYHLDVGSQPALFTIAEEAAKSLGYSLPLTLWQAQNAPPISNAALCFTPDEAHIIFSGPVISLLNTAELRSVIGHELAHHLLWTADAGDYLTADRLLDGTVGHPQAAPSHQQTFRRWRLYTEIFCDRGALVAAGNLETVIAGLVKVTTGLTQVSGAGYLAQADELFARAGAIRTDEVTHPETFIRARALRLWQERGPAAEAEIAAMIEGEAAFAELDLVGQARVTRLTRRLLEQMLRPRWFQTDATLRHARRFFADFAPAVAADDVLANELQFADMQLRDYFGHLLLDFAAADPELDDLPLCAALGWAERLGLGAAFDKLVTRELKVKARELKKLKESATERLATAEARP